MDAQQLLAALKLPEDREWEFKSGLGGLPGSLCQNAWEGLKKVAP